MVEITAITPQMKDKTRCNIEADGRFFCGMKLETVIKNHLKVGDIVSAEALSRMQLESDKTEALDKALTHIGAAMKTEKEIRDFLRKKGYLEDVCDFVVERMKEYSFLDDGAYAKAYAENAGAKKGHRLIAAELRRKGVGEEEIASALETLSGEEESAFGLLKKYLRGKETNGAAFRKGYAYLIGKGFDYDTAKAALVRYGEENED